MYCLFILKADNLIYLAYFVSIRQDYMWVGAFCYLHLGLFFPWCQCLLDLWPIVGSRPTSKGPLLWTCGEKVAISDLLSSWWVQEGSGGCPHYTLRARDLLPGCSAAGIWGRKCEDNEGTDIKTSNRETQGTRTYAAHRQGGKNRNTENGEEREGQKWTKHGEKGKESRGETNTINVQGEKTEEESKHSECSIYIVP